MIEIQTSKLIIEIVDDNPQNLLIEVKNGIITILQNFDFDSVSDKKELETAHYFLLKILKELN